MSLDTTIPLTNVRTRLAHALGYLDYPANPAAEPYLTYICKRHVGDGALEDWLELFISVIKHFEVKPNNSVARDSIQALIDNLALSGSQKVFADTNAGHPARMQHVEDTVMYIFGLWTTMLGSFIYDGQSRKITSAYAIFKGATSPTTSPYAGNLCRLISGSGLLPGGQMDSILGSQGDTATKLMRLLNKTPSCTSATSLNAPSSSMSPLQLLESMDSHEVLSIKATQLNAYTLSVLSGVDVSWTYDISRHLLLTKAKQDSGRRLIGNDRYVLEIFSMPCALDAICCKVITSLPELAFEVRESYGMLFHAWRDRSLHMKLGFHRVCWCWSCSAARHRKKCIGSRRQIAGSSLRGRDETAMQSDFDPQLEELVGVNSYYAWTPEDFPHLWSRITRLEQHLLTAKPWSLTVLFRDRRDTMQFWTFLFATIVVVLTIVQVLLGIAQVVGSFT